METGMAPAMKAQVEAIVACLSEISPAQWCQLFFILAAAGVLIAVATPSEARALLADYGARKASSVSPGFVSPGMEREKDKNEEHYGVRVDRGCFTKLIAVLTAWGQVPHSWFAAFYALSLACSAFWLGQYLGEAVALRTIASRQASSAEASMTLVQLAVVWGMMVLQAGRRIYEHATVIRPSNSTMWFVHWVLGLAFYLFVSVSVWVEGSGEFCSSAQKEVTDMQTSKVPS